MRRISLIAAVILAMVTPASTASMASAADTLLITGAGYFRLSVDSDGTPVVTQYGRVVDLTGDAPTLPPNDDNGDTPAPPVETLADRVEQWTLDVDNPDNAQALAVVKLQIARMVRDGEVAPAAAFPLARNSINDLLDLTNARERWSEWRDKVSADSIARQQRTELRTAAEVSEWFTQVATGLERAVPDDHPALSNADAVEISGIVSQNKGR